MPSFGFNKIVGNDFAKNYLLKLVREKNCPQSLVLTGQNGVGKLTLAIEFALALLCQNPTDSGACGKCNSCHTYASGMNPNIYFWYPKGQNTTIDQMRSLKENAGYAPIRNKYKVNIIQNADTLNTEASNSILKVIEEPPEYLVNILVYDNQANILQTIRSRSILVALNPVEFSLIKKHLTENFGVESDYAEFLSRYSMGSVGKAVRFIDNAKAGDFREAIFNCIESVIAKPHDILSLADFLSNKNNYIEENKNSVVDSEELKSNVAGYMPVPVEQEKSNIEAVLLAIDMLCILLRDLLVVLSGEDNTIVNIDKKDIVVKLANKLTVEKITSAIKIAWTTKDKIKSNVNLLLSLEDMLSKMYIEFAKN